MGVQLQPERDSCITPSVPIKKGDKSPEVRKSRKKKRKDFDRNEDLVFSAFLMLEKELGKKPTQIQVSQKIGLSRQKVNKYFKKLKL